MTATSPLATERRASHPLLWLKLQSHWRQPTLCVCSSHTKEKAHTASLRPRAWLCRFRMDLEAKAKGKRKSRYFGSFVSPLWASVSLCVEWEGRAGFESVISLPKHMCTLSEGVSSMLHWHPHNSKPGVRTQNSPFYHLTALKCLLSKSNFVRVKL